MHSQEIIPHFTIEKVVPAKAGAKGAGGLVEKMYEVDFLFGASC